jgi:hypothetical protein
MGEVGQLLKKKLQIKQLIQPTRYCKGGKATHMQDVGKTKLENTLQFTNYENDKRMQAQEILLGCLQ